MSAYQRHKGASGEREVIGLLRDRLGPLPGLERNLSQYQKHGYDFRCGPYAVEVKRSNRFLSAWIEQSRMEAVEGLRPALLWRPDGRPWTALVIETLDEFAERVREQI